MQILLYSLIFLLSVLGNTLVITVLIRNKRMRTVTNIFLLSLAVSDLMLCLFCMPFNLIPNLLKDFIFGSAVCKTTAYFMGEWLQAGLSLALGQDPSGGPQTFPNPNNLDNLRGGALLSGKDQTAGCAGLWARSQVPALGWLGAHSNSPEVPPGMHFRGRFLRVE